MKIGDTLFFDGGDFGTARSAAQRLSITEEHRIFPFVIDNKAVTITCEKRP